MTAPTPPARPWYAGRTPPDASVLEIFDQAGTPEVLYDLTAGDPSEGDFAKLMRGVYDKMDTLKRNPDDFRSWTAEDGYVTFYNSLIDIGPADIKSRVGILQQLGAFKFRAGAGPDEMKKLISAIFEELQENEDANMLSSSRARRLQQIWAPPSDSLLSFILSRPAQVGRVLSDRLNPANGKPLRLVGHPFAHVRSIELQPIADARIIAFDRGEEIHIIPAVRAACDRWDADSESAGGVEQVSIIDALLLHELVELVMQEQHPDLPPVCSHLVATIFERYLKGNLLPMAVEDFFFEWPTLSEEEEEERREEAERQELREAEAMFAEEQPEELDDEGIDDLPIDDAALRKKKVAAKKKAAAGKPTAKKVRRKKE